MMMDTLNLSTQEAEAGVVCEFETSQVYIGSSRPARATWWDPVSNKKQNKTTTTKGKK